VFTARYGLDLLNVREANVQMVGAANNFLSRQCLMVVSGELRICKGPSRPNGDTVPPFVW
jgi:hypothetical protein